MISFPSLRHAAVAAIVAGIGVAGLGFAGMGLSAGAARAAEEAPTPPAQSWSFNGPFGTFDRASAQRGLQAYREVCAACHGLKYVAFRNLAELGFSSDEVRALAAEYQIVDGPDETGAMFERPGIASDRFVSPYPNEQAARAANGGAYPPDLSLIAKARVYGPDYLYAFLTGFTDPPEGVELDPGTYYNLWFPGHVVGMPDMVFDGAVNYGDGTEATEHQIAWDLTNFLMWAAEPAMEERKQIGIKVLIFLAVFGGLLYVTKRKVWAAIHH